MSGISHLKKQLTRYKDLLANLSRKNRELYFKESKGSTINLSKFPFTAGQLPEESAPKYIGRKFLDDSFAKLLNGGEIDLHDHFVLDEVKDREFANRLSNRLDRIRLADDKHQREFGISGAWLLGPFLCWRSSPQAPIEDLLMTPLFKVPVDLKRNKKKHLVLNCEESSLTLNPSLRLCLKQHLGIVIPEELTFESAVEAVSYLRAEFEKQGKSVSERSAVAIPKIPPRIKVVKDENGNIIERKPVKLEEALSADELEIYRAVTGKEFLLLDVVYLDQLNASRAVLISDYEGILKDGLDHPILNELFNGTSLATEPPTDRSKLRELDAYRERENHFVVDIDSTQHRAIDKATKSRAIVIQGPPGSGKSQTIVNLIADYLAKGKKVLFVSEKRPALDVVFNRMKGADIESQAVLIHSSDLNKPELYKSFLELASLSPNPDDARAWENTSKKLDLVKTELNDYAAALQSTHRMSQLPSADVLIAAAVTDRQNYSPEVSETFNHLDFETLEAMASELASLQEVVATCPNFYSSVWLNRKSNVVKTTALVHALSTLKDKLEQRLKREADLLLQFSSIVRDPVSKIEEERWAKAPLFVGQLNPIADVWDSARGKLEEFIAKALEQISSENMVQKKTMNSFLAIMPHSDPKLVLELENYYRLPRGPADWFSGAFWSYRSLRKQLCPTWSGSNRVFAEHREHAQSLDKLRTLFESLQKASANHENETVSVETICAEKINALRALQSYLVLLKPIASVSTVSKALESSAGFDQSQKDLTLLKEIHERWISESLRGHEERQKIAEFLLAIPDFVDTNSDLSFVERLLDSTDELSVLDRADIQFEKLALQFDMPRIKTAVVNLFGPKKAPWDSVIKASVLNGWADQIISEHSELRSFGRDKLEKAAQLFRASVQDHKMGSRQAVREAFAKRWSSVEADRSGLPLLTKESAKQRKVLSPREIMEKGALRTMLQLKPCWLMSPLSISQLLPLTSGLFDVIIFDEASQVRVEDAVPSIYRASTMIVVGDDKQMPPTSFFSGAVSDDDDDEEEISPSVLDLAAQVYPAVLLEWHYRSRSESLIAFSNRAFYGGRLIAAPNPQTLTAGNAFRFHQVKEAYFTSKDGNPVESNAVVSQLIDLLKADPTRSYGIIAMGVSQAEALQEALENKMSNDPATRTLIERAYNHKDGEADAGLFIKNLENVQGDERDVILMSVGYAPAAPGKDLRLGFGPLSMKGGGRRLNVAITRAKIAMHVFASFSPTAIPTDEETLTRNPDLCVFGRYLKYAEAVSSQKLEAATAILDSFPVSGVITNRKASRFSKDVKRRLEEKGFQVSSEIGSSGFYIDLAIHHPVIESSFLVGIECDGAFFHATPYARDRDKIRQDLLQSRGWKILRVWSQDWSRDWEKEIVRIGNAVNDLMQGSSEISDFKKASGA